MWSLTADKHPFTGFNTPWIQVNPHPVPINTRDWFAFRFDLATGMKKNHVYAALREPHEFKHYIKLFYEEEPAFLRILRSTSDLLRRQQEFVAWLLDPAPLGTLAS